LNIRLSIIFFNICNFSTLHYVHKGRVFYTSFHFPRILLPRFRSAFGYKRSATTRDEFRDERAPMAKHSVHVSERHLRTRDWYQIPITPRLSPPSPAERTI